MKKLISFLALLLYLCALSASASAHSANKPMFCVWVNGVPVLHSSIHSNILQTVNKHIGKNIWITIRPTKQTADLFEDVYIKTNIKADSKKIAEMYSIGVNGGRLLDTQIPTQIIKCLDQQLRRGFPNTKCILLDTRSNFQDIRKNLSPFDLICKLPHNLKSRIFDYFQNGPIKHPFDCNSFVHFIHGFGYVHGSIKVSDWEFLRIKNVKELKPGSTFLMTKNQNINSWTHVVLYLGQGLYISKFGMNPVRITTFKKLETTYGKGILYELIKK